MSAHCKNSLKSFALGYGPRIGNLVGELFTTFHTAEVFLNNVTSPYRDKYTLTPEYKVTAVRVEKL